jgi:hypothetical protein
MFCRAIKKLIAFLPNKQKRISIVVKIANYCDDLFFWTSFLFFIFSLIARAASSMEKGSS